MRSYILASFCVALITAAPTPDVSHLGYNYPAAGGGAPSASYLPPHGGNLGGIGGGLGGGLGGLGGNGGIGGLGGGLGGALQEEPLINKHFYIHSAPEDTDSNKQAKHFTLGRAQKNYRVVFIKAPSSSDANTKLSAEYAPSEEKTVIYVLSQKEHEIDVNDIATPAPTQPSKPEVFFIKYKTPEEAAHAQQQIQSQYDALGGQSEVSDEGIAPVSSVEGALGGGSGGLGGSGGHLGSNGFGSLGAGSSLSGSIAGGGSYLPPSF